MKNVSMLCITIIVVLAACNPATPEDKDTGIQTAIAQTQAAEGLVQTLAAQTVAASIPTVTLTPTETLTPTPTLTPEPPPSVTLLQNANCRSGPGTVYPNIVTVMQGETLLIDGQNADQTWWRVLPPDRDPCWLPSETVELTGSTNSVAVLPAPPTPTPGPVGTSLVIRYGQTVTIDVKSPTQTQYWAFMGNSGDRITVYAISNTAQISISIRYPSTTTPLLGINAQSYGSNYPDALIDYTLVNSGYHYISVYAKLWDPSGVGSLTLTLTKK